MTVVSAELVEKAEQVLLHCWHAPIPESADTKQVARLAIEAVLPDIERPWQEKVEKWDRLYNDLAAEFQGVTDQLVERDKEIKRLQASVNEQLARANERTVAAEAQLAERQFSDAEREALLGVLDHACWLPDDDVKVQSARAKLEEGQ